MSRVGTKSALPVGRWQLGGGSDTGAFTVRNFGLVTVRGTVDLVSAEVRLPTDGRPEVTAELDLTTLRTGNPRRDKDLQAPKLLNTAAWPRLRFRSVTAVATGSGWQVDGELLGQQGPAPLQLQADLARFVAPDAAQIRVTGRFDRRALGIRAPRVLIGRWIDVDFTVTFRLEAGQPGARPES